MTHNFLSKINNTWTLFLDRDGVINKRIFGGYVTSPSEFEFISGVLESIKYFSSIFYKIIIVTNQQGVAKGIMTEDELITLNEFMVNEITKVGGKTDAVYYCTDLATAPDNCRKPSINMAKKAVENFPKIDLQKSIMVGDSQSDIEFGKNAGMKTIFVTNKDSDFIPTSLSDMNIDSLHELKIKIQSFNHSLI
jgi:histidinol-phosphate phosphatase family protein